MATPNNVPPANIDYFDYATYEKASKYLKTHLPKEYQNGKVQVGIVCGSGLGGLASLLSEPIKEFDYKDIPGFGVSTGMFY